MFGMQVDFIFSEICFSVNVWAMLVKNESYYTICPSNMYFREYLKEIIQYKKETYTFHII